MRVRLGLDQFKLKIKSGGLDFEGRKLRSQMRKLGRVQERRHRSVSLKKTCRE